MNTQFLTLRDREDLLTERGDGCVSIYLPVDRTGNGLLQPPIQLKNDAAAVEQRLTDQGRRAAEARDYVAPLRALVDDHKFWNQQATGLALFLSPTGLRTFRLRTTPQHSLWTGDRFRILPLLGPGETNGGYYVLAVSAKQARLFRGSRDGLRAMEGVELPQGLVDALNLQTPNAFTQTIPTPDGKIHHGDGGEADRRKVEMADYLRLIDRALQSYLRDSTEPLVFAGVEYLFPIYREVNTYPHLWETPVTGTPERIGDAELHLRAEQALAAYRRRLRDTDAGRFENGIGLRQTAESLPSVLALAHQGAVEALFVAEGPPVWGRYDPLRQTVAVTQPDDPAGEDLFDLAAYQTLKLGGRVHVVPPNEVPLGAPIAALLRFARPAPAGAAP